MASPVVAYPKQLHAIEDATSALVAINGLLGASVELSHLLAVDVVHSKRVPQSTSFGVPTPPPL